MLETSRSTTNMLPLDLTKSPIRHAHCCLSLSTTLLDFLVYKIVQKIPGSNTPTRQETILTVLSVGSGTGLLEEYLNQYTSSQRIHAANDTGDGLGPTGETLARGLGFRVEGLEVYQTNPTNLYLPESHISTVLTSSDISPRLRDEDVCGLLFVYPRQMELVQRYIKEIEQRTQRTLMVVIAGGLMDLEELGIEFDGLVKGEDGGVDAYEGIGWVNIQGVQV